MVKQIWSLIDARNFGYDLIARPSVRAFTFSCKPILLMQAFFWWEVEWNPRVFLAGNCMASVERTAFDT